MARKRKPFHEVVAERLIQQLKEGTAPWQKPWHEGAQGFMPTNPHTGKRYKGINAVKLMSAGYDDNRWMTYKQAEKMGAQVTSRARGNGESVQYWKFNEQRTKYDDNGKPVFDANGDPVKVNIPLERPRVFYATVFNAEHIDGLPPRERSGAQALVADAITHGHKLADALEAHIGDTPDIQKSIAATTRMYEDVNFLRHASDELDAIQNSPDADAVSMARTLLREASERAEPFADNPQFQEQAQAIEATQQAFEQDTWERHQRAENILSGSGASIFHDQPNRAYYNSRTDEIHLPTKEQFDTSDRYYATALHELGHWTGHSARLDRDLANPFGSEAYAVEELKAECFSMLLGEELGIGHDPEQHAAYVGSWIRILENDPLEIFRATSDAEKMRGYVVGLEQQQEREQQHQNTATQELPGGLIRVNAQEWWDERAAEYEQGKTEILRNIEAAQQAGDDVALSVETMALDAADRALSALGERPTDPERVHIVNPAFDRIVPPETVTRMREHEQQRTDFVDFFSNVDAVALGPAILDALDSGEREQLGENVEADIARGDFQRVQDALHLMARGDMEQLQENARQLTGILASRGIHPAHENATVRRIPAQAWWDDRVAYLDDRIETLREEIGNVDNDRELGLVEAGIHNVQREYEKLGARPSDPNLIYVVNTNTNVVSDFEHPAQAVAPTAFDQAPGRLVDRLVDHGVMDRADAQLTDAVRDLRVSTSISREGDERIYQETSAHVLGEALPLDWNGEVETLANVAIRDGDGESVQPAESPEQAEFYSLYAEHESGMHAWVADFDSPTECQRQAYRLSCISAYAQTDTSERDAQLQRASETQILTLMEQDSLMEHLRIADSGEIDRAAAVLDVMEPLNNQGNDFWRRHSLPYDLEPFERRLDAATRYIEDQRTAQIDADHDRRIGNTAPASDSPLQSKIDQQQRQVDMRNHEATGDRDTRQYIDVPYKEKDEAKALGARWDRKARSWYVPSGADVAAFSKWSQSQPQDVDGSKREYLAVPYSERKAAKAAGARWDKQAKSWYVGPSADRNELARWQPGAESNHQDPAMTPQQELAEALTSIGCTVPAGHPIMDGEPHRIPAQGDKPSEQAGFYIAHADGHPAGFIANNRTGVETRWKSKGYALSDDEKATLHAEAATKLAERDAERERTYEDTAQRLSGQLKNASGLSQAGTPYHQAKGIQAHHGVSTNKAGDTAYIPAYDAEGKHWTTQYVNKDGRKRFAKNSRKEGCFHSVGGLNGLADAPALVIAEGYATASTAAESLGYSTVAAFDSGNLKHVAEALHEKYPDKPIVIAGDDDQHQIKRHGRNPGREKAEQAAEAVNGVAVLPVFAPGEQKADSGAMSDFNDLAQKSSLGRDGVARQLHTAVEQAQRSRTPRNEQTETRTHTRKPKRRAIG